MPQQSDLPPREPSLCEMPTVEEVVAYAGEVSQMAGIHPAEKSYLIDNAELEATYDLENFFEGLLKKAWIANMRVLSRHAAKIPEGEEMSPLLKPRMPLRQRIGAAVMNFGNNLQDFDITFPTRRKPR